MTEDPRQRWLETALLDGDLRFLQFLDAMPHMVWMSSLEGGCEFVNRRWVEYTGIAAPELLGDAWRELIHPEDRERMRAGWRQGSTVQQAFQVNCRIRGGDGGYRWFDTRGAPLRNADGRVVKWFGTNTDIHDAFEARQALAKNEERLRYVSLASNDCVYDWDIRRGETYRNEAFQKIFGAPATVRSSERWWERRIHPDDRKRVVDASTAAFKARELTWRSDYRLRRPDGNYADVTDRAYLLYDENKKPVRMIGAIADITERKQVEQSLRDIQDRLESAMAAGELATWIWDLTKDEIYWDAAAYRMWGIERDGLPMSSARVIDLMHPDDQARVLTARSEFIGKLDDTDVDFRIVHPDGSVRWLLAKGRFSVDERGNPVRMVGVYQDITERKYAEAARLSSQKMEALGTLAGGIAHDFNNLLLVIAGNTRLALEDLSKGIVDRQAIEQTLREVDKASLRASELVKRILMFSRHQDAKREAVSLRPIVEEALRLLRPTLPASIEIRTNFDRQTPAATVDAIQIHQVIMNLVTNAAHAIGSRRGAIDIHLCAKQVDAATAQSLDSSAPGDYACISVRDNGCGIEPALLGRIFDPFFTTKKPGEGTGLGLAVVHGIVKAQGGAIAVRSDLGHGSEFVVYLPAAGTDVAATAPLATLPLPGAGQHVLYVDDEEPLVYLIVRVLERLGYRVTGCIDPEQALAELRADPQSFDVLVTDLAMRGMNGFELTRAAHAVRADLPVLLTSGYLRTEDRETAQQMGIRELILKPNTVEELGQAIDRALAQSRHK